MWLMATGLMELPAPSFLKLSQTMTVQPAAASPKSQIAPTVETVDGLTIRYATTGRDARDTVLLCSPWPESLFAFAPIWDTLSRDFSLVAFDLPGFGQSEGRTDLMSPHAMGEFVVRLADHFGLGQPHVIGPDVGTPALLFAAANHPRRFRSIVAGSGASTYPLQVAGDLKAMIEAATIAPFRTIGADTIMRGFVGSIRNYAVPAFVRDDYIASYAGERLFDSMTYVRNYPSDLQVLASRLPQIATPVQLIVGRNDPYGLCADAERLQRQLPVSKLDVLETGHCVWEEDAANYGRIVSAWMKGGFRTLT
jgi:pimeloyl-ACP methyl ester carboxylesterase